MRALLPGSCTCNGRWPHRLEPTPKPSVWKGLGFQRKHVPHQALMQAPQTPYRDSLNLPAALAPTYFAYTHVHATAAVHQPLACARLRALGAAIAVPDLQLSPPVPALGSHEQLPDAPSAASSQHLRRCQLLAQWCVPRMLLEPVAQCHNVACSQSHQQVPGGRALRVHTGPRSRLGVAPSHEQRGGCVNDKGLLDCTAYTYAHAGRLFATGRFGVVWPADRVRLVPTFCTAALAATSCTQSFSTANWMSSSHSTALARRTDAHRQATQ